MSGTDKAQGIARPLDHGSAGRLVRLPLNPFVVARLSLLFATGKHRSVDAVSTVELDPSLTLQTIWAANATLKARACDKRVNDVSHAWQVLDRADLLDSLWWLTLSSDSRGVTHHHSPYSWKTWRRSNLRVLDGRTGNTRNLKNPRALYVAGLMFDIGELANTWEDAPSAAGRRGRLEHQEGEFHREPLAPLALSAELLEEAGLPADLVAAIRGRSCERRPALYGTSEDAHLYLTLSDLAEAIIELLFVPATHDGIAVTARAAQWFAFSQSDVQMLVEQARIRLAFLSEFCQRCRSDESFLPPPDAAFLEAVRIQVTCKRAHRAPSPSCPDSDRRLQSQVKALRRQVTDLKERVFVDSLTKVYSRAYLKHAVRTVRQWTRQGAGSLACLLVDVNDFKKINDSHGHLLGDRSWPSSVEPSRDARAAARLYCVSAVTSS